MDSTGFSCFACNMITGMALATSLTALLLLLFPQELLHGFLQIFIALGIRYSACAAAATAPFCLDAHRPATTVQGKRHTLTPWLQALSHDSLIICWISTSEYAL